MTLLRAAGALFGFGVLVLLIGLFVAPMIATATGQSEQTVALQDGEAQSLQQNLNISASIDSQDNAVFTLVDQETFNENVTAELSPGGNDTVLLSGATITVEYDQFSTGGQYAVATVQYPSTFQYDRGTKLFYEELGLLLSIIGSLMAITGLVMGVKLA